MKFDADDINAALRRLEYEICQSRGHQPSGTILMGAPPMHVCRWCGTHYRTEEVMHERNTPASDGLDRIEAAFNGGAA